MRITDQSQADDVQVSFVEGDDGRSYIHWLSISGGNAMVFVAVDDASRFHCIHSFVLESVRPDSNLGGAPVRGVSFTLN